MAKKSASGNPRAHRRVWYRVYRDDTTPFVFMTLTARAYFTKLLSLVDDQGRFQFGKADASKRELVTAICRRLRAHQGDRRVVRRVLDELIDDGCVRVEDGFFVVPGYAKHQGFRESQTGNGRENAQTDRSQVEKRSEPDAKQTREKPELAGNSSKSLNTGSRARTRARAGAEQRERERINEVPSSDPERAGSEQRAVFSHLQSEDDPGQGSGRGTDAEQRPTPNQRRAWWLRRFESAATSPLASDLPAPSSFVGGDAQRQDAGSVCAELERRAESASEFRRLADELLRRWRALLVEKARAGYPVTRPAGHIKRNAPHILAAMARDAITAGDEPRPFDADRYKSDRRMELAAPWYAERGLAHTWADAKAAGMTRGEWLKQPRPPKALSDEWRKRAADEAQELAKKRGAEIAAYRAAQGGKS